MALHLIRGLFPSWRFFEEFGSGPRLLYRFELPAPHPHAVAFTAWQNVLEEQRSMYEPKGRGLLSFVFNPRGNFILACNSLVDQLVTDAQAVSTSNPAGFGESVSYQLTANLIRFHIGTYGKRNQEKRFQFKVVQDAEDVLISAIHEV